MTINGIVAELGSAVFNLQFVWENTGTKYLYFVGMFLSNNIVLTFAIMIFWIDGLSAGWCAGYIVIVGLLYILRTEGWRRALVAHFCPAEAAEPPLSPRGGMTKSHNQPCDDNQQVQTAVPAMQQSVYDLNAPPGHAAPITPTNQSVHKAKDQVPQT